MLIYIVVLLLLIFFTKKKLPPIYAVIILILLAALRSAETGIDLWHYVEVFTGFREVLLSKVEREQGYGIYSILIGLINNSSRWFIIATSLTILFPLYFFLRKSSSDINLSLLLFYLLDIGFVFTLSGIRQSIALSLFLVSLIFIVEKKYLYGMLLIFVAATFHNTVIFVIPFVFLSYYNWQKYIYVVLLIFSGLIGLSGILSLQDIFENINIDNSVIIAYKFYVGYAVDQGANLIGRTMIIIPNSILVLLLLKNNNTNFYFKLFCFGVILTNLGAGIPMIFRYFSYLTILQIILIPQMQLYDKKTKTQSYFYITFLVLYFLLYVLYRNYTLQIVNNFVPYRFLN